MATWNTDYEDNPENSDDIGQGAAEIRSVRTEVRDRAEVEHDWGTVTSGYSDTGRHTQGSGRVFVGATAPANLLKPDNTSQGVALGLGDSGKLWVDTSGIYRRIHYWTGTEWVGTTPATNYFVNGQFQVHQRTAFASSESSFSGIKTYWFDRWYTIFTGGTGTVNRETTTLPSSSISTVGMKLTGGTSVSAVRFGQRLESAVCFALGANRGTSVTVTVSGRIRNTGASTITGDLVVASADAADNFAAVTTVTTSVSNINVAAGASQNFSASFGIGSAAAGTPENGLDIYWTTTAPASFTSGESFVVTDLVLEVGSAITPQLPSDFQAELARCRRYYQKSFAYGTKPAQNWVGAGAGRIADAIVIPGSSASVTNPAGYGWLHEPEMRSAPTVVTFNPRSAAATAVQRDGTGSVAVSSAPGTRITVLDCDPAPLGDSDQYLQVGATFDAEL